MRRMVLVLAIGLLALSCKKNKGEAALPPPSALPPPQVPQLEVAAEPSAESAHKNDQASGDLVGTGTLHPRAEAELGPKASGTLVEIKVEEGDRVKKGQVLFRLDASQNAIMVTQARAQLSSAEVQLASADLELKRTKELLGRGSVAQATFDQAQARYDAAKAGVEQARASVAGAQRSFGDAVVKSPIDGVVTARMKSVGETVTMVPPTTVLIVQDVSRLELRARLPERALSRLVLGAQIRVSFPAIGKSIDVAVTRINPALDPRTRTVEVIADIANGDGSLKPGMLAEINFTPAGAGDKAPIAEAADPVGKAGTASDGHPRGATRSVGIERRP
jgi:RND family efflux transporter MFP subunit